MIRNPITACVLTIALLGISSSAMAKKKTTKPEEEPAIEYGGVKLGDFFHREVRVTDGAKVRLSFTLYAEVEADQLRAMTKMVRVHRHRIRDQVIVAIRLAKLSDFLEPDLKRLKTRILSRLKRSDMHINLEQLMITEFEYFNE